MRKWPPFKCPWTMVIDTREQLPYDFDDVVIGAGKDRRLLALNKVVRKLDSGDYSIKGLENKVAIERKSKEDCYGTIGKGRQRFIRELERLNEMDFAAVVVESEWLDLIRNPPPRTEMTPASVNGSIVAFQQRFPGVHWWFLPGRYVASKQCWKILDRFFCDHAIGDLNEQEKN